MGKFIKMEILTTGELKKGVVFTTPLVEMRRVELLSNNLSTRTSTSVVCYYYSLKNNLKYLIYLWKEIESFPTK